MLEITENQLSAYKNGVEYQLPYFSNATSNQVTQNTYDISTLSSEIDTLGSIMSFDVGSPSVSFTSGTDSVLSVSKTLTKGKYLFIASPIFESQNGVYNIRDSYSYVKGGKGVRFYVGRSDKCVLSTIVDFFEVTTDTYTGNFGVVLTPASTFTAYSAWSIKIIKIG